MKTIACLFVLLASVLPSAIAATISPGETTGGGIRPDEQVPWTFSANAGDTLLLTAVSLNSGVLFYPGLTLRAPDGTVITNSSGFKTQIVHRALETGLYTVLVTSITPSGGLYGLSFFKTPGPFVVPANDEGGTLPGVSQTISGKLSPWAHDIDPWAMPLTAGQTLSISIPQSAGPSGPTVDVYDPTGRRLLSFTGSGLATLPISLTGSHTLLVSGYSESANYAINVTVGTPNTTNAPVIEIQPESESVAPGEAIFLTAAASGPGVLHYRWFQNGMSVSDAELVPGLAFNATPSRAGIYTVAVANTLTTLSNGAIIGVAASDKVLGTGTEVAANVLHPNRNTYDQILLNGPAAMVNPDPGQIVRTSFLDLNNDLVQVELSGAGCLNIVLANATGPVSADNYNQPGVQYMKGHASLILVGADETTHLSVLSVGSITAVNQGLFKAGVNYDGVADLALIAVSSRTGRMGSIRCANAEFFGTAGYTGIYAPGVRIDGPVLVHNVSASGDARPVLLTGSLDTGTIKIAGGDMAQPNGQAVQVGGVQTLTFTPGTTSHNVAQPARANFGHYTRDGVDVTAQLIQTP